MFHSLWRLRQWLTLEWIGSGFTSDISPQGVQLTFQWHSAKQTNKLIVSSVQGREKMSTGLTPEVWVQIPFTLFPIFFFIIPLKGGGGGQGRVVREQRKLGVWQPTANIRGRTVSVQNPERSFSSAVLKPVCEMHFIPLKAHTAQVQLSEVSCSAGANQRG